MPRTIRYHLDEHCSRAIASGLRLRGIEVVTTAQAGLLKATDVEHLAFALAKGLVLFTQDSDFVDLHNAGEPHNGIVFCAQHRRSLGEIIRGLELIWEVLDPEDMRNQLEYI